MARSVSELEFVYSFSTPQVSTRRCETCGTVIAFSLCRLETKPLATLMVQVDHASPSGMVYTSKLHLLADDSPVAEVSITHGVRNLMEQALVMVLRETGCLDG